jgi:ferrous iron transport protein B
MAYLSKGTLTDYTSLFELKNLLVDNGWTTTTAICTMVFSLMHWPCSTALITIKKETGSLFWTFIAVVVPTIIGMLLCILINLIATIF